MPTDITTQIELVDAVSGNSLETKAWFLEPYGRSPVWTTNIQDPNEAMSLVALNPSAELMDGALLLLVAGGLLGELENLGTWLVFNRSNPRTHMLVSEPNRQLLAQLLAEKLNGFSVKISHSAGSAVPRQFSQLEKLNVPYSATSDFVSPITWTFKDVSGESPEGFEP